MSICALSGNCLDFIKSKEAKDIVIKSIVIIALAALTVGLLQMGGAIHLTFLTMQGAKILTIASSITFAIAIILSITRGCVKPKKPALSLLQGSSISSPLNHSNASQDSIKKSDTKVSKSSDEVNPANILSQTQVIEDKKSELKKSDTMKAKDSIEDQEFSKETGIAKARRLLLKIITDSNSTKTEKIKYPNILVIDFDSIDDIDLELIQGCQMFRGKIGNNQYFGIVNDNEPRIQVVQISKKAANPNTICILTNFYRNKSTFYQNTIKVVTDEINPILYKKGYGLVLNTQETCPISKEKILYPYKMSCCEKLVDFENLYRSLKNKHKGEVKCPCCNLEIDDMKWEIIKIASISMENSRSID